MTAINEALSDNQSENDQPIEKTLSFFQKYFTPKGRINRIQFLLYISSLYFIFCLLYILFTLLHFFLPLPIFDYETLKFPLKVAHLIFFVFYCSKRYHDQNLNGNYCWLLFVPIANIGCLLMLVFDPGDKSINQFGHPPPPNGKIKTIMAIFLSMLILFFIGYSIYLHFLHLFSSIH